jgi:trehalose utilization protein
MIRVTVWNEYYHERNEDAVAAVYPEGIHNAIAGFLSEDDELCVRTVTLDDPECGLSEQILNDTDVLIWWSHLRHEMIPDDIARRVSDHVLRGMGFIPLHSSHFCKPFGLLMGTSCTLKWRDGDRERVWCVNPGHPIASGVAEFFELESEEMYGEHLQVRVILRGEKEMAAVSRCLRDDRVGTDASLSEFVCSFFKKVLEKYK